MTEWGTGAHTNMLLIFPLKILLYPLTTTNTEKTCKNLRKKVSFALYTLKLTSPGCHYSIKEQHHPHLTGKSTVSPCLIYKNMLLDSGTWDLLRHLVQLIAAVSLKQAFWNKKKIPPYYNKYLQLFCNIIRNGAIKTKTVLNTKIICKGIF